MTEAGSAREREAGRPVQECTLTDVLLDLDDKVMLWILAVKGKGLSFSGFDGQHDHVFFRKDDVTGLPWQSWGPGPDEHGDATSGWQSNLRSF